MDKNTDVAQWNLPYLERLARDYPTVAAASNEIINLEAILQLPKGTEHYMSDIHGEYEAFTHILNNASGVIREKVDEVLEKNSTTKERASLATLIYYPMQKLQEVKRSGVDMGEWYRLTLYRLVEVCHHVASKSTRKFVRHSLPRGYEYIIDELLQAHFGEENKRPYYETLLDTIISTGQADNYINALAQLIKELAVYKLHIVGDVFDRGSRPDIIMDMLMAHHSVDIQWGNHDVLWMGACAGSDICIANAMNVTVKYHNMEVLEDGYGINLRPLALFAEEAYKDTDCNAFRPKLVNKEKYDPVEIERVAKMSKAIAIIMFKLESQAIDRNPDFGMEGRKLLPRVNFKEKTIEIDGILYPMKDCDFPTVDPQNPTALTEAEHDVMVGLRQSFMQSEKLNRHVQFLYEKGSIYKIENRVLMFHGVVPLEPNGTFTQVKLDGNLYTGRGLMDYCDKMARQGFFAPPGSAARQRGLDFLWYLWCGPKSPVFGRDKMTTFERLFIADKNTHTEKKDNYYRYTDSETVARFILASFDMDPAESHIVNGHVPVKASRGENPIKAGGRVIMIDGGFSKAYQSTTGIAGYTLVYTSRGLSLRSHQPFESIQKAVQENMDILSTVYVFEHHKARLLIKDTDEGQHIAKNMQQLYYLVEAYRQGLIPEHLHHQLRSIK